jgi:hypothetical protein
VWKRITHTHTHTHTLTHKHTGIQGIVITKFIQDSCVYFLLACGIWRPYLHFLSLSNQRTPAPYLSRHTRCCLQCTDFTRPWAEQSDFDSQNVQIFLLLSSGLNWVFTCPVCYLEVTNVWNPIFTRPIINLKWNKLQRRVIWKVGKTFTSVFRNLKFKTEPKGLYFFPKQFQFMTVCSFYFSYRWIF